MIYPERLTPEKIRDYFPDHRAPLKDGIFELGLALGGTASAGAYTAGVLDYLLEALDAWQRAKDDNSDDAPRHEVVISTIAGSSGGGINGAILLRAVGWRFPHGPHSDNPFYSFWMGEASDFWELLRPGAAAGIPGLTSLLNCVPIDIQASRAIEFKGEKLGTGESPNCRAFLADPLRHFITVGNLTGVPYAMQLAGETALSHVVCAHGDYMQFALRTGSEVANKPVTRPDEVELRSEWPPDANWMRLRDAAVATGAFPILLLPRPLSRLLDLAGFRVAAVPRDDGRASDIVQLVPDWPTLTAGEPDPRQSTFLNVDGGVFNNEPFELVHSALAGFNHRNPRDAIEADRAVIMIDPLSDPEALQRPDAGSVASVFGATVAALISQARFKPQDIALASAENVYSRYLIAPVGPGPYQKRTVGQGAIASGGLGGQSGYIDRRFRAYDFQLGRCNAHKFLAEHLALPVKRLDDHEEFKERNNRIFRCWKPAQVETYAFPKDSSASQKYLPIIPLMPHLRDNPPRLPDWPRLKELPDYIEPTVQGRLQSLYELATSQLLPQPLWRRILPQLYLGAGWRWYLRGALCKATVDAIRSGLVSHGLVAELPPVRTAREAAAAFR